MKRAICRTVVFACAFSVVPVWAQNTPSKTPATAIVIPDADMQAKLKEMITSKLQDEPVRIVNTGDSNLGVFLIHLNPGETPKEPVTLMSHSDVSEVYYVLKGEGVLYHGGTFENPTPRSTRPAGPGLGGPSKDKLTQKIGPGDVFIIPPNTPHQVNLGAKTEMVYLVVRVDPKKHLETK